RSFPRCLTRSRVLALASRMSEAGRPSFRAGPSIRFPCPNRYPFRSGSAVSCDLGEVVGTFDVPRQMLSLRGSPHQRLVLLGRDVRVFVDASAAELHPQSACLRI